MTDQIKTWSDKLAIFGGTPQKKAVIYSGVNSLYQRRLICLLKSIFLGIAAAIQTELKVTGEATQKMKCQLYAEMIKAAGTLAHLSIKRGNIFDKIRVYGLLVIADENKGLPFVLIMNFVKRTSFITEGTCLSLEEVLIRLKETLTPRAQN